MFVLNALLRNVCSKHYLLVPWEAAEIQNFAMGSSDTGAKRTFWAYFSDQRDWMEAERCLALYYDTYYVEGRWCCINASSAAVHMIRTYDSR